MSEKKWTPEQRQAIETVGKSLLVSAAAGSGKTSVLAERCVHLVCDAEQRCGINQLLVVTFTEAAAAEMKKRITDRLVERANTCAESERRRLRGELTLVEQANISTLHSFCLRLIRQHFHRLDLDPAARVIDQDEAALLRSEIIKDVFARRYETGDDAFAQFVEAYGDGRDENLMNLVVQTQALMESLVNPHDWRQQALARIEQGANMPLPQSEIGGEFLKLLKEDLIAVLHSGRQAADQMPSAFDKYRIFLDDLLGQIEAWPQYASSDYDTLADAVKKLVRTKLPSYPDTPERVEPKKATEQVRKALDEICALAAFTADEWRAGLKAIVPHAQAFLSLVEDFAKGYQRRKRELSGLDFADQERFALQLLQIPEVAALCHTQFKHVLVDEYQDINSVQEAILAAAGRENNQFCVGDVKQSIYRFRLAEPGKFLAKSEAYKAQQGGSRIDLKCNFRSRKGLLDAVNGVFKCLMSKDSAEIEYDASHELVDGAEYPPVDGAGFPGVPVELHVLEKQGRGESAEDELDRTEREALLIARQIREMVGKRKTCRKTANGWELQTLRYSDMAILLRATAHKADYFADVLRQHDIPVQTDRGGGFFEASEIRDLLALLELLDNQQQDVPLAAVLRSPIGKFDVDALARIRLAYPDEPFHRAARLYANGDNALAIHLREFFDQLSLWRTLSERRPLADVVWKIYTQTGYLLFCAGLSDGNQRQANLLHFHQRCKQFGRFGHGLYRFLRFVEKLKQEQETARPAAADVDEDAVRLMSIHAAKGLEFPVVFVPDLGKMHNKMDMHGSLLVHRQAYLGMATADQIKQIRYPSLAQILVRRKKSREMLAEELRLLYVAMTRAKEHLVLIGTSELSAIETWQRWAEHYQVMPPEQFLKAGDMLDWLGPVAAKLEQTLPPMFEIHPHSLAEISQWQQAQATIDEFTPRQQQLAALKPVDPAPDETAQRIIARLEYRYPHENLTRQAAARAVSAMSKKGLPSPVGMESGEEQEQERLEKSSLRLPSWLNGLPQHEAVEIGSATHRVLQHLDFSRPPNQEELDRQIEAMITRRLLAIDQRTAVQVDSILWLLNSDLGVLLRKHARQIMREMPIYFSCEPAEFDAAVRDSQPQDRVMVRGRLDAVVETDEGLILLDYKTDRMDAEQIDARSVDYDRQIGFYREALQRMGGRKIAGAYLVFLTPRVLRKV